MVGKLTICDKRLGDKVMEWDTEVAPTVEECEAMFNTKMAESALAYTINPADPTKGEVIRKFDPTASEIIITPNVVGG